MARTMNSDPGKLSTEREALAPGQTRSPADVERALLEYLGRSHGPQWCIPYPFSSFLALALSAGVAVALWMPLILLAESTTPGGLLTSILACSIHVLIVAAQFSIMWYFRTGILTSMMIAFVTWCHVLLVGFVVLAGLLDFVGGAPAEPAYDFPSFSILGIPCIAFPVAILHGTLAGLRHGRNL